MLSEVKRWGNSYAIRLRKSDLQRLGLREGDPVHIQLEPITRSGTIDLSGLPLLQDPDPLASKRHDAYLYGARP
jgi:hypothetical protein